MVGEPLLKDLLLGGAGIKANLHIQRWNAVANETVLITADERITKGLEIGLHAHAEGFCGTGCCVAEIGLDKSFHFEHGQRHDRQEHVNVDVRNHGFRVDCGASSKIFRSEQSFLFRGNKHEQNGAAEFLLSK